MKRRQFVRAIAVAPAVPALLAQQPSNVTPGAPTPQQPPAPNGRGGRGGGGRGAQNVAHIELTELDVVAETTPRFFSPAQFAALRKLSGILAPSIKGSPGALDTDAPEFIDFLIGASPADRRQLYRNGLDYLNAQSGKQFGKPFAELAGEQADTLLKPLFVPVAWAYDPPKDPIKHFIYQAHQDIRTATRNAPSESTVEGGGRRGFGGGLYWNPVDPV